MASPQPRKRARLTRASRRAATFELLGDGTARTALPVDDARKSAVLATASGEFRCGGQNQASLEAIKRFLAACDDDGEVASSPLSRADADVALRCCEAGATLELPSLVKLGVARLRSVRGATSPPTGRRRLARNIQESDNSRLIDTRVSAFYWNFTLRGDGVVMITREFWEAVSRRHPCHTRARGAARRVPAARGHPQLGRTAPRLCKPRAISVAPRVLRESYA